MAEVTNGLENQYSLEELSRKAQAEGAAGNTDVANQYFRDMAGGRELPEAPGYQPYPKESWWKKILSRLRGNKPPEKTLLPSAAATTPKTPAAFPEQPASKTPPPQPLPKAA